MKKSLFTIIWTKEKEKKKRKKGVSRNPLVPNGQVKAYLICEAKEHPQKPGQMHLPGCQLAPARVVGPVEGCCTVHDQQRVPGEDEHEVLVISRHE